jgi:hypothetical protein
MKEEQLQETGFIYNTTTQVHHSIIEGWLQWMKEIHIPETLHTKCFDRHQLVKLLHVDETDGVIYAVQYFLSSKAQYNRYVEIYAPALREKALNKWGDKIISFHSLMQVVH